MKLRKTLDNVKSFMIHLIKTRITANQIKTKDKYYSYIKALNDLVLEYYI